MARIHPLAVVSPQAELGVDVVVGPFCVVESGVRVGEGCHFASHVVVKSGTTLGKNNRVLEGTTLGGLPQHVAPPGPPGELIIGDANTFREQVTIHRALKEGHATRVGNDNYIMVGAHFGHDCQIGNRIIFANHATIGGHVSVQDRAFLSAFVAVHQFCRIGQLAMVGGMARITRDIPPFVTVDGGSDQVVGLNTVGLRRNGYTSEQILQLKMAYRVIYRSGMPWNHILETLKSEFATGAAACYHPFLSEGKRGFVQERRESSSSTVKMPEEGTVESPLDRKLRKAG